MPSPSPAEELAARLAEKPVKTSEIAAFLDALGPRERVEAVRGLGRREQRNLYTAADGFAELRLADLVPEACVPLQPVRHYGRNTLPVFTLFEKRFFRPEGADARKPEQLWGYNHQPTPLVGLVTGPGYFEAREDFDRAEVLIDYTRVPSAGAARPVGWPAVRSNERAAARFVYGFMVDTLRRVSEHVSIGSAARKGKDLGSWFILCRQHDL